MRWETKHFIGMAFSLFFYIFGAFLIKQLFHSRLLDMRMVIANSYPMCAHGIIQYTIAEYSANKINVYNTLIIYCFDEAYFLYSFCRSKLLL